MLEAGDRLALYMEGSLGEPAGKMGYGLLRYSRQQITCVIDRANSGKTLSDTVHIGHPAPIVPTINEALKLGANWLVLGIAPSGGMIPKEWWPEIDHAVASGLSIMNGLHERLAPRYANLPPGQRIWDMRVEPEGLGVGTAAAAKLSNRRVLFVGTDMAVGKMTAGLEVLRCADARGISAGFVATGQIGIAICGTGVPLDAVRVDFACSAIEREVLRYADKELILVEGQGAIIHPGSTSSLPLLRGSCPSHLILCHRANQTGLLKFPNIAIPPLDQITRLLEDLGEAIGTFPRPKTVGISLNTFHLDEQSAKAAIQETSVKYGLPTVDPVRQGADELLSAILA